jgi:acetyl-CoA carboxylase biotin carboxylase subunit
MRYPVIIVKLGLLEERSTRPPTILVLGQGALAEQIKNDFLELGLKAQLVGGELTDFPLPKLTDIDAKEQFEALFRHWVAQTGAEWVHPGVTLWSERSEFEGWARQAGLFSISVAPKTLHLFWNTHHLIQLAEDVGVPNLGFGELPMTSIREIENTIRKLAQNDRATLPFVLRSAFRARSGYGSRIIRSMEDLQEWVPIWLNQLREYTGQTLLFIEKHLESPRSYYQPFARLKSGEIEFFPIVDASLTFEGKNWIEVCPAQSIDNETKAKIEDYTRRTLEKADFVGVGGLIFMCNGREVYLTEGLARPNFAYRLWENVGRTKALQWQLHALAPGLISQPPKPRPKLQAASPICGLNLKIYAEDTWLKIPHPGAVHEVSTKTDWAEGANEGSLVWDYKPGQEVLWNDSGSIGHLTVFADGWKEVLSAARSIMKDLWISGGIQTNERFLFDLLSHPWVEESMFYTGFVDEEFIPRQVPDFDWSSILTAVMTEVSEPLSEKESWIWLNQRLPMDAPGKLRWTQRVDFEVNGARGVKGFFQKENGEPERICAYPLHAGRYVVRVRNWFFSLRRSEKGRPLQLMALTGGRIHSIFAREGSKIEPKKNVLIIECHQRLVSHRLPVPVLLKELKAHPEDIVKIGQELAELERWSDT